MSVIYRKYRPQSFSEMIGQNHIKITLQNQIAQGEVGHAYLFCGPRGLGKTTAARILAKAINCEKRKEKESEPCDKCSSCLDIINNRSIDIIEIDAASHTGVDNVRENIIENSRFTPSKSKFKVFIIDEVHMLSTAAFNALLKTLEEPPAHVIFILCTTEIHKLPQTIISRCQRFDFKKVPTQDMLDLLIKIVKTEKKKVEEEVLRNIVLHSEGCVRDAESLLGKILSLGDDIKMEQAEIILPKADYGISVEFIGYLVEKNSTAAVELINRLVEEGVDLQIFTENLIEMLRKIILLKVNSNLSDFGIELDEETLKSAQALSEKLSIEKLISAVELFTEASIGLKSALIYQLPLEMAAIKFTNDVVCEQDDDDDDNTPGGIKERIHPVKCGNTAPPEAVFNRVKEKINKLNPLKKETDSAVIPASSRVIPAKAGISAKSEEIPLSDGAVADDEEIVKVNLLSKEDKLKPINHVDFDKIKENWSKMVEALLEKNFTLSALLKISQPLKCRDNVLEIAVKSNFYKERLEGSNKRIIEEVISEYAMAQVIIRGVVDESLVIPELQDSGNRPVFGADPLLYKSKVEESPIARPQVSADVVADVMSMF